jgi:hypothetical protein
MATDHEPVKLFGWSWNQWAIAAGRLGRPEQVTYQEAIRMRCRWQQQNSADPGEVKLAGVVLPMDHTFACELFSIRPH